MRDDETMDDLLRVALTASAPPPTPSAGFDQGVLRRTATRRLTSLGRVAMAAYAIGSLGACAWFMRGLPLDLLAASTVVGVVAALGIRAYAARLAGALDLHPAP